MDLIVDAHNLMFFASRRSGRFAVERGEAARTELLRLLSRYQAFRGDRILCVFDGGLAGAHLPRRSFGHGLQVLYSPPRSDADSEIKALVFHHDEPGSVRVITSDNALRAFVEKARARVTSSQQFLDEMERSLSEAALPADEPAEKYEGPDQDETDYWLGVFGEQQDEATP